MASTVSPAARQLGAELRMLRKAKDLSTHEVGRALGRAHTHVSRWERGELPIKDHELGGLLTVLGASAEDTDRVVGLAADVTRAAANWLSPGIDKQLDALAEYETLATHIFEVNAMLLTGLLQTPAYAQSIMVGAGTPSAEAESRVKLRMRRSKVLTQENAPNLTAIIGEYALRYPPCDRTVMRDQHQSLLNWAERPNVEIRVLPLERGYTAALEGAFMLLEFAKIEPIVYLEHYRSTAHVTDRSDLKDFRQAIDDLLRRDTLSQAESAELIQEIFENLERK